jgi:hypothetical protein
MVILYEQYVGFMAPTRATRYLSRAMPSFHLYKAWSPAMPISQRGQARIKHHGVGPCYQPKTRSRGFVVRLL